MVRTSEEFFSWYHNARHHLTGTYEERQAAERKMISDWLHELEVGDHAHICRYSDIDPVTVVKKTATTITVRKDKAVRDPAWKPEFIPGGFSAHCVNNDEQKWIITEDPNGDTEVFRWHKRTNRYENTAEETLYPGWMKKYDYNF